MYIKVDDGQVEGILPHDGYVDAGRYSPAQLAALISERGEFTPPLPGA